jgi:hypothetical protein
MHAQSQLESVVINDADARRRALGADDQMEFFRTYQREIVEGDLRDPEVWLQLEKQQIKGSRTEFVLGTGEEADNLRTALSLRQQY